MSEEQTKRELGTVKRYFADRNDRMIGFIQPTMSKRRKGRERKPIKKPDNNLSGLHDLSGLLRTLRLRKPSGGKVTLAKYAVLNRAA